MFDGSNTAVVAFGRRAFPPSRKGGRSTPLSGQVQNAGCDGHRPAQGPLGCLGVWEPVGDVLWTREIVELHRATFSAHDAELDRLVETYRIARLCMDQTGMGEKPVEHAVRRYGAYRFDGVLFTGPNKLTMATTARTASRTARCAIPSGKPRLRADLHRLRKVASATRFLAEDESNASGSHADRACAYFLGLLAASGEVAQYGYEPADRRAPRDIMRPDDNDSHHLAHTDDAW